MASRCTGYGDERAAPRCGRDTARRGGDGCSVATLGPQASGWLSRRRTAPSRRRRPKRWSRRPFASGVDRQQGQHGRRRALQAVARAEEFQERVVGSEEATAERLIAGGRMTSLASRRSSGRRQTARGRGWKRATLSASPATSRPCSRVYHDARRHFDAFPRSRRRDILEWIDAAKRPATRAARIVKAAREGVRRHPRQPVAERSRGRPVLASCSEHHAQEPAATWSRTSRCGTSRRRSDRPA